jgi:hypothetical protein
VTNLYDFLREILSYAQGVPAGGEPDGIQRATLIPLSEDQFDFLKQYMTEPDVQVHFKARRVGGTDEDPVTAQDYAIAGDAVDVFSLLTEAMLANYQFANLVNAASRFYWEHVGNCPECLKHTKRPPFLNWDFKPHKPLDNAKKQP